MTDDEDVPLGVDFREPDATARWVANAEAARPWRSDVRRLIADRVRGCRRILELGPGPGWLAEAILATCDVDRYVVLDFAQPMLDLCRARLGDRVETVLGDFKRDDWPRTLAARFDAVVAMQSVHELRHKRHVPRLYRQIREVLDGILIITDHEPSPSMLPPAIAHALCATEQEHHAAMRDAGYAAIETLAKIDDRYYVIRAAVS